MGGYAALDGAVGVLPVMEDNSPNVKAWVARWLQKYPGREPGSEASLNYTAMRVTALAMQLAGTTTDATAIHAKLDEAIHKLPAAQNLANYAGMDANGGTHGDIRVAVVEGGKIKEVKLSELGK